MHIDVALVPDELAAWENRVIIVVDVIRASSTIVTLLGSGCRSVIPVADADAALALARKHGFLCAGERGGRKVADFDYDNSPSALGAFDVKDMDVVLSTSNGTYAIEKAALKSDMVLIGSALNAGSCARSALKLAGETGAGIGVACAGRKGRFTLDDGVCAGLLVSRMMDIVHREAIPFTLLDGAKAGLKMYRDCPDLGTCFMDSGSAQILKELGKENDVGRCAQVDAYNIVPFLRKGAGFNRIII